MNCTNESIMFGPNIQEGTFNPEKQQWMHPVQVGASAILAKAMQRNTIEAVNNVLEALKSDPYIDFVKEYYSKGIERFGDLWGYADQISVLYATSMLLKPRNYLEIGVFRGRSMSIVASVAPECSIYGFDMWIDNYSGLDNPGQQLILHQLDQVNFKGEVKLISGNSHDTVPSFLEANEDLFFDLITVDGDHTEEGARIDIENVLSRLRIGGAIIFDDISHPSFPWLERVWDTIFKNNPNFVSAKYTEVGHGVAIAIRHYFDEDIDNLHGNINDRSNELSSRLHELKILNESLLASIKAKEKYEASLRETIDKKDNYIISLQDVLSQKEHSLQQIMNQQDSMYQELQKSIHLSETYVSSLQDALKKSEEHYISAQDESLLKQNMLEEKDKYIQSLINMLEEKDKYIQSLIEQLNQNQNMLEEKDKYIQSLIEVLELREIELQNSRAYIEQLNQGHQQ